MNNEALAKTKKTMIITSVGVGICFVISSFCFFIGQMWISLGFLIGLPLALINNMILYNFSYYLTRPRAPYRRLSFFSTITRLLIYGLGFFICIIFQYFGFNIFFWGTCLASYMINIIVMVIVFK